MKSHLLSTNAMLVSCFFLCALLGNHSRQPGKREQYRHFLKSHPFYSTETEENEVGDADAPDRPDMAWEQDYLRTMDPALGRPAPERLTPIMQQVKNQSLINGTPGSALTPWVERGPNNVGGRTRALAWDPNDATHKKVWAGGVTGGLWYNTDITNANSPWVSINDFWANISITSIAFDPNNSQVMFVATGEGWGAKAARGAGIFKSTDGGQSWTQLSSTSNFYYVNDLVVRNEAGVSVIYAAVDGIFYQGQWFGDVVAGLRRSTNGGASWTQVLPVISNGVNYVAADIEISANNRIWIGTKASPYSNSDRGGGRIMYSDNGTSWTVSNTSSVTNGNGRVEIACAPSNASYVYAMIEDGNTAAYIKRTTSAGSSWSTLTLPTDADNEIPGSDFTRGQAWYDLILAVDPNNENNVIAGGVDLFRSTTGGSSWSQISKWSNNNNLASLSCSMVHADQHAVVYQPGSSSTVIFGNDGGIFYTSSIGTAAGSNVISMRNKNYNVTQFYACAINPNSGSNYFLAGAQDNGTQRFTGSGVNTTTSATGGDGAYCFIDQNNPNYQITAYTNNNYYLSTNGGSSFNTLSSDNTGRFINPADYDDNMDVLYSASSSSSISRIKNITSSPGSAETVSISGMQDYASHLRVSPYTTTSTTLFIGTEAGDLFKVGNANGSTPVVSNIGSSSFPNGSISCIEIGASESELMVTFFNYGVTSVWYTSNGGSSWVSKEGNLPDMPVRWALFNPSNRNEVILATELGVWSTTNFSAGAPAWSASSTGLANVRVDMFQVRNSDKEVIAATYGRGLFSSSGFNNNLPPAAAFSASTLLTCSPDTVTFTDTSAFFPTSWTWTVTPSTYRFVDGTNANSQNPKILFTAPANYTVTLKAGNNFGVNSTSKNVIVGGYSLPFSENFENNATVALWSVENPDADVTWSLYTVGGTTPGTHAAGIDNWNYSLASQVDSRDGLISPPISLNGYNTASLSFKHAYKRYSPLQQDSLAVYVSTDCGGNWTRVQGFIESSSSSPFNFITGPDNSTSAFLPATASDWCGSSGYASCISINLSAYVGNVVRIKFESMSGYGNNMYIDNISVTGTSSLSPPVADFSASATSTCLNTSVTFSDLTSNSPNTWGWTFTPNTVTFMNGTNANSQNPVIQFTATGTYTVELFSLNAIGNSTKTKTNYITVNATVIPGISISTSKTTICAGDNAVFNASATGGGSSPVFAWKLNGVGVGTSANSYSNNALNDKDSVTCVLTSNANCAAPANATSNSITMNVNAVPPTPAINQSGSTLTCSVTGTGYSYQWFKNGVAINASNSVSITITQSGTYAVEVSNSNNCKMRSANFQGVGGVNELFADHELNVYPNPAYDHFVISFNWSLKETFSIELWDMSGRKLLDESFDSVRGTNKKEVALSDIKPGVYLLKMRNGSYELLKELVIGSH